MIYRENNLKIEIKKYSIIYAGKTILRQEGSLQEIGCQLFLLMGDDYIGNSQMGRIIHGKRKLFDSTMEKSGNTSFKSQIYNKLSEMGLGREITVIGGKKKLLQ